MSTAAKLKKRAIELEQKKQLDKALALYIQFLQESGSAIDDADVPLYNRVGDLLLRTSNVSEALNNYEKAIDLYAERGFLNNAIALCNKVLRQAPGRASIYYKLGKISATKGFKSDAKKNFLEYADRMQKTGHIDEAFRALKEFADLCPDQDDIRLMLAEQLSKENRQGEALEQLQKLHDKLNSEGRSAEARATADRMKAIDPEAVPRTSGSYAPQKSNDLIFLDTTFEQQAPTRPRKPTTPPGRQVSDPDLVVLTLGDKADTPISPVHNAAVAGAFDIDLVTPADSDSVSDASTAHGSPNELPLLEVTDSFATPAAHRDEVVAEKTAAASGSYAATSGPDHADADASFELPSDAANGSFDLASLPSAQSLGVGAQADPAPVDLAADSPYVSGAPLGIDYAADLVSGGALDGDAPGSDLFDFRSPPRSDDFGAGGGPPVGLDPDVAFPSFDLDDVSLPSADDVTSGGGLAAALIGDQSLDNDAGSAASSPGTDAPTLDGMMDLSSTDTISFQPDAAALIEEAMAASGNEPADASVGGLELEWPASLDGHGTTSAATADVEQPAEPESIEEFGELVADATESEGEPPKAKTTRSTDADAAPAAYTRADRLTPPAEMAAPPPTDPWQGRHERAERLLEAGDRAGGINELEAISSDLERAGDLERAWTIVDELIRLSPDSIRHHQKRVELAFRAGDRPKLIDAYIELGDALFRAGEERKALAVYQRVLELAPDDPRARVALDTVQSASPPAGAAAIPAAPPASPQRPVLDLRAPETHSRPASAPPANGARYGNGVTAPAPPRKPSPLDRNAANADFVDLGDWIRASEAPKSTRMVTEEKPPTGDEQADFQEMLKRFKQGVADNVDDEDYESHYDLGVAYKEMGLIEEAVAEFQKALRGTAHRVRSYEALGQCFVEKEQYQVASSVLSRAMALGEGDDHHLVGVLYLMGRATEALDRPRDALDYYQRVFAVDIEFRDVAERIGAIQRKAT